MAFETGERIGDYEIVAELGAGGLGVVYEVRHLISRRREAMKILLPEKSGTPEMAERFRREVQTLATLNHPNIAALHTAFYNGNQLAMVMELVHGETLEAMRVRAGVTLPQVLGYAAQVLEALRYAHRLGVVHRDIKPSNIMITEAGVVKLLDFGIAFQEQAGHLTRTGYLLGSLNYMSPEQVSGGDATARSDIYSVGITLYELLTGVLPIEGKTSYEIMLGHMHQIPVPPHERVAQIPVSLSEAVMRALEKDPARRFQSAEEFLRGIELSPAMRGETLTSTRPLPAPPHLPPSGGTSQARAATVVSGSQSLPLEEVTRKLAVYIGPVAKFVVKKLAAQYDDPEILYREAAKQIPSETDRAAFLRSKRQ